MKTQNVIISWLQENLQRLFTKSPKFFLIWSIISGALVLITGVPDLINWVVNLGNSVDYTIVIPDLWNANITKAVAYASRGIFFMSLLTTQSNATGVLKDGSIVKETNVKALPFTAVAENKVAEKTNVPEVKITKI